MAKPHVPAAEALADIARQLQYAVSQSDSFDAAADKLRAAAGPSAEAVIDEFTRLLRGAGEVPSRAASRRLRSLPTLAWLLRQTPSPERSAAALLQDYQRHESFQATTMVAAWNEFAGFLAYLGAVLTVLTVIVLFFAAVVMPEFRALYSGLSWGMPTLTTIAFGGHGLIIAVPIVTAATSVLLIGWFVLRLRSGLRRFAPLGVRWQSLPLVGPVARDYGDYLRVAYANLLQAAGVAPAEALRCSASRVPLVNGRCREVPVGDGATIEMPVDSVLAGNLATAAQLGRLGDELLFQREASADRFLDSLARCRRRARIMLTVVVYTLVAVFVWSMYLPLFWLGNGV